MQPVESEMKITLSTGSEIVYLYCRDSEGVETITRTLTAPEGTNTVVVTVKDIKDDANRLFKVAEHFQTVKKYP